MAKVHPDHHVQVAKALYSVPTAYLGQRLDVRIDRSSVHLYRGGELVKVHVRVAPGKRATDASDYPDGKAAYATRSIDKLCDDARAHGEHVGRFVSKLLDGPLPWTKMRQGLCARPALPALR